MTHKHSITNDIATTDQHPWPMALKLMGHAGNLYVVLDSYPIPSET